MVHAGEFANHVAQPLKFAIALIEFVLKPLVFRSCFGELALQPSMRSWRARVTVCAGGGAAFAPKLARKEPGRDETRREPGYCLKQGRTLGHGSSPSPHVRAKFDAYETAPLTMLVCAFLFTLHASSLARVERTLLPYDTTHAVLGNAERDEVVTRRRGATGAEREVVFAGAAFIAIAGDEHRTFGYGKPRYDVREPNALPPRDRSDRSQEHAVTDGDAEIFS